MKNLRLEQILLNANLNEVEAIKVVSTANDMVEEIKKQGLTHYQAMEALCYAKAVLLEKLVVG